MTGLNLVEVVPYNEDSVSPLTVFKPPGAQVGDLLIVVPVQDAGVLADLSTPSGWLDEGSPVDTPSQQAKVFSHVVAGGDPSTWDFPYNAGASMAALLLRYSEAEQTPTVAVTSASTTSNGTTQDSPTITPTSGGDGYTAILTNQGANSHFTYTAPAGLSDMGSTQAVGGLYQAIAAAWKTVTDGSPTGAQTWSNITPTARAAGTFSITVKWSGLFDPDPPLRPPAPEIPPWLLDELLAAKARVFVDNIGAPVIQQIRSGGASGANVTLTTDVNTQAGDLLVLFHGNNFYTASQMLAPTGTSLTWTQRALGDQGTNTVHMKIWTAPVTVTGAQTVICAPAIDEEHTCHLFVVSGADPTTPVDVAAGGNGAASTSQPAPSLTTTVQGTLLLCGAQTATESDYTAPPGMVEQTEVDVPGFMSGTTAFSQLDPPTTTGTKTFTCSANQVFATASIAIKPVQVVAPPPSTNAPAELADSSGAANDATPAVAVNAECATGSGAANDATVSTTTGTNAPAEAATASGTANDALIALGVNAEAATGSGAAGDAVAALGVNAEAPTGSGASNTPVPALGVNAEAPTGSGAAGDAVAAVAVNAECATGSGTAYDATVTTSSATSAPAEAALASAAANDAVAALGVNAAASTGSGAAQDPTAALGVNAEAPTGSGAANAPTPAVAVNAECATGSGTAFDATVTTSSSTSAPAEAATGSGTAADPVAAVAVNAECATGSGSAFDATVTTSSATNAPAGLASGSGAANDPTPAIAVFAECATGSGVAYGVTLAATLANATSSPLVSPGRTSTPTAGPAVTSTATAAARVTATSAVAAGPTTSTATVTGRASSSPNVSDG